MLLAVMQMGAFSGTEDAIQRLRRSDPGALAEFITQYQHRLYRFLVRLLQDGAAAEDVFQQTWVRVMEKLRQYDSRGNFEAWLFTTARNLAIDQLRKRRDARLDAPDTFRSHAPDPLDQVIGVERGEKLAAAIAKLPAIHREVLALRFEEEMKLDEIAEIVGIPLSTVKSRLHRALEGLRAVLEER
jgi:RNA polymerase sigma-70 factor (ECF subfamily)